MALWSQDRPDLESIKIRVYPPLLTPPGTKTVRELRATYPHAQLAPLLGPGLQFGLPGGTTKVVKAVTVVKPIPSQPGFGPGVDFANFLSYRYDEDFLTPSDAWEFAIDEDELSDADRGALMPGARVEVSIDDNVQSVGFMRNVRIHTTKDSGSVITASGRDWLSPVVDSHISPLTQFSEEMNLEQLMQAVFGPFGIGVQFSTDDTGNLNAITGAIYGTPTSKKGKPLKSFLLHQLKPYPQEGAFQFAARVAQRFGLWIWPMVDGKTVMVGQPTFTAPARYAIHHKVDASSVENNVIEGDVSISDEEQPAIIFATGFGGGGDYAHAEIRGAIVNPLVQVAPQQLAALLAKYPGLIPIVPTIAGAQISQKPYGLIANPSARALYLEDQESKTQSELNAFLRKEMALRMRRSLDAHYTVLGHKINRQPIAVNTTMDVDDDRSGLHMPLWVLGRSFSKVSGRGTLTRVNLIRPGSLAF